MKSFLGCLALVLFLSSVYGQSGSNNNDPRLQGSPLDSGCSSNQVLIGKKLVERYCKGLGKYGAGSQNRDKYNACIADAVKNYLGECLRNDEEADDLATVLCNDNGSAKEHSEEVNKRLCCVGQKFEQDNTSNQKAKAIIQKCQNQFPDKLF